MANGSDVLGGRRTGWLRLLQYVAHQTEAICLKAVTQDGLALE